MPSKHSKNAGGRHHYFSYEEKHKAGLGSIHQRIGNDSQLPFGFCPLTLNRINEAVVSPSGRIYEREAILEYLLTKTKELKEMRRQYDKQMLELDDQQHDHRQKLDEIDQFTNTQENVNITSRSLTQDEQSKSALVPRKRIIDDTTRDEHLAKLKQVSPWIPQFTPSAKESMIPEPPKRPLSPFSQDPLRSKDLIPVTLTKENIGSNSSSSSSDEKFICPISRKTITNQKVILIKSTGVLMLESAAQSLAYPSMICPLTSKPFKMDDVIEIVQAASGFAASGQVEVKKYRPTIN